MSLKPVIFATCILQGALVSAACDKQETASAKKVIGHVTTRLGVRVGGTWIPGYSVEVAPQESVIIEHERCPNAKDPRGPTDGSRGICVLRITKEQSDRFEAAMERFKRYAVPLQTISVVDPWTRPDGKPCRNESTDATMISLTWTGTEGIKIATFYTGCDEKDFASFYNEALAVTDPLPIQQIIGDR